MATHQDISEPLENAVFIPRKQEERTEGKSEDTLETRTQQIGHYTAREGSPEDTLNTDHTQRSKRLTPKQSKLEDALYQNSLNPPEVTEKIDHSGTLCNFSTPIFALSGQTPKTVIDMTRHSKLRKLIRTCAWINRFVTSLEQTPHSKNSNSIVKTEPQQLTQREERTAFFNIIRQSQDTSHAKTKQLGNYTPKLHLGKNKQGTAQVGAKSKAQY